ncbi:bone morphogenetic protein 10 [Leptinotarsa decemlineata]|uniref:bone morphogenetic protein 10 n=1 Tax=Leptinotarsa decemlineata TaxID=7539 RepID=UPI003D30C7AB
MLELYERNKIGGESKERPDVVRSLIPTHGGEIETIDNNEVYDEPADCHFLIFDIPTITEDEHFLSAELKILTLLDVETRNNIGVRRILKISIYDDTIKRFLDFQEIQLHHLNNSWVSFDVTAPVNNLLHTTSKSKILKISITISSFLSRVGGSFKLSLMPPKEDFEHDYPILLLSYSSDKEKADKVEDNKQNVRLEHKRKKRSLEDDYEEETNRIWDDDASNRKIQMRKMKKLRNSCKRKPLYIDFAEIKYDMWIVQPSGYEAYQCQGRCFYPVADHLNPTKHAILQTLLHSVAPSKVSRSCCVPTVLDSISVLYVDTNGVLTYRYSYKDMVVAECGCR